MEYYHIEIPRQVQPSLVLSVEKEELGIEAGLQDRVIQVYEGLVYMDFSKALERTIRGFSCYNYEPLDLNLLPPLYIACHSVLSEPTEVFHDDLRSRFTCGEIKVVNAMNHLAKLAELGRDALLNHNFKGLGNLINENFDTRRSICNLPGWQVEMVETARRCGATAHFAGSGGAIVGTYTGEPMLERLCKELTAIGSNVQKLQVA
jgi:glucuronokinase